MGHILNQIKYSPLVLAISKIIMTINEVTGGIWIIAICHILAYLS